MANIETQVTTTAIAAEEANQAAMRVEAVSKRYGKLIAVDNVSLEIGAGEIYSLVGANGAGKSTLMRAIIGTSAPDDGEIFICGHSMKRRSLRAKRFVGYLPEELLFYERLTGREYLQLVAGLKGADVGGIEAEIDFFELRAVAEKWTGSYSLGMRKKLGLAAAFTGTPRVLVLDEPLNGLDVEMMRRLRERIEVESERGNALLISSHVMEFVERISHRVGVMRGGKLIAEGTPRELRVETGLSNAPFEDVFFHLTGA